MERSLVYLDHAATTPMRASAVEAMLPFLTERFANPSGSYRFAHDARRAVDEARDAIAAVIGCRPGEIVFTGSGTEADNTVIAGGAVGMWPVCPAAEHHAVLHAVERAGGTVVAVDATGAVDLDALRGALSDDTSVVSVMAVNNEVGTITDLAAVAQVVRESSPGALVHTDAVQAAPWLDLRHLWPHVDALSLSAHKFGGPKGAGVMVLREGTRVPPLLVGGGQERDRRSGTHNVAGIVATATALVETDHTRDADAAAVRARRDRLVAELVALGGVHETVAPDRKVAGAAHICVEGVESEALLFLLDEAGVCASAASACAAGAMEPSHVLAAMGVDRALSRGALRLTLGHTTTDADIDRAVDVMSDAVVRLRRTPTLARTPS
ncbi:cysteine desulfurase family protein [Desertimonas flava]|uniref:cysteine desulfurase family protein n=1 Tax=Desertimonas flava TaxID=2064846 RepID=UPI001D0C1773|nr:cysteine desulfurase family protein [Desertimonas flava]